MRCKNIGAKTREVVVEENSEAVRPLMKLFTVNRRIVFYGLSQILTSRIVFAGAGKLKLF